MDNNNNNNNNFNNNANVNNKNGINTVLLILVIVLTVILLVFGAYFLGTKNSSNSNNSNIDDNSNHAITDNDDNDDKAGQEETKKLTQLEVEQLLEKFGFNYNLGCEQNIFAVDYSEEFKMIFALTQVEESQKVSKKCSEVFTSDKSNDGIYEGQAGGICIESQGTKVISYDVVNAIYNDLYGTDMPKKSVSGLKVNSMFFYFYDYNDVTNQFIILDCDACGGSCGAESTTFNKVKDYTENESELIVNVYYGEAKKNISDNFTFNGHDLDSTNKEDAIKEIESKYINEVDVYEVVFTKQNGNYIFKNMNKK